MIEQLLKETLMQFKVHFCSQGIQYLNRTDARIGDMEGIKLCSNLTYLHRYVQEFYFTQMCDSICSYNLRMTH